MARKRVLLVIVAAAGVGLAANATAKSPAPGRCAVSHLHITLVQASPGASHHGYVVRFKNKGTSTCTLKGYPGVDGLAANGHKVISAKRTKNGYLGGVAAGKPIELVHLAHGETASAMMEWHAPANPKACAHPKTLVVTPPGSTTSVHFSPKSLAGERLCGFQVHPVVPGRTGMEI